MPNNMGVSSLDDEFRKLLRAGYGYNPGESLGSYGVPMYKGIPMEDTMAAVGPVETMLDRPTHVVGADPETKQRAAAAWTGVPASTTDNKGKEKPTKEAPKSEKPAVGSGAPAAATTNKTLAQEEAELEKRIWRARVGAGLSRQNISQAEQNAIATHQAITSMRDSAALGEVLKKYEGSDFSDVSVQGKLIPDLVKTGRPALINQAVKMMDSINDYRRSAQKQSLAGQWRQQAVEKLTMNEMIMQQYPPDSKEYRQAKAENNAWRTVFGSDQQTLMMRGLLPKVSEFAMLPEEEMMGGVGRITDIAGAGSKAPPAAGAPATGAQQRPADLPATWREANRAMVKAGKSAAERDRVLKYWYPDYPGGVK